MKKILPLLLALCSMFTYAQNSSYKNFGRISQADFELSKYDVDSTANAAVLYENAETKFLVDDDQIITSTAYYFKIKIFNQEGFDHATFSIPYYNSGRRTEKVKEIRGLTHNGLVKTGLTENNIFKNKINDNWDEVTFTMPNLKKGSIIEVRYIVKSPFKFNLTGWEFQSDIPKLYSEYKASIPGNYVYNRKKIGSLRLTKNESIIKKECFRVPGFGSSNCEVITYAMKDIPAFVEEEYMTSKENYMAALKFEISEMLWFDGSRQKYTKTWEAADNEFKTDNDLGRQLRKYDFFSDKLPEEVTLASTDLEKAKLIHRFITDHYVFNKKYGFGFDVNVKKSYEERTASATAINLSLINALKAAGLNVNMMLISTRGNGLATKNYPVISDFNYCVAKLDIGQESYLLDATSKNAPFGLLPFDCLNSYGRVMDFDNASYWYDIIPEQNSKQQSYVKLSIEEDGSIVGQIRNVNYKYDALERRNEIQNLSEESVIEQFEARFPNYYVESYEVKNLDDFEKPLTETFNITVENDVDVTKIMLNPFIENRFTANPFKQEKRSYPVDFGYPRKYYLTFTMDVADGYSIGTVPTSKRFVLEEDGGSYALMTRKREDYFVQIRSTFDLKKSKYFSFEYPVLKELFRNVVVIQNSDIIIDKQLSK